MIFNLDIIIIIKDNSYMAQYPVLRSTHSASQFIPWQIYSIGHHFNVSGKR